ncbi:hypothetical protein BN1723_000091, partial [Verticillium longisporum]
MPAPTALKVVDDTPPSTVPLPEANDEELLLDAPDLPAEGDLILQKVPNDEHTADMIIDEENRPRFAPGNDISTSKEVQTRQGSPPISLDRSSSQGMCSSQRTSWA